MVYLTHYTEYPIYYPEEGGYYTAGCYVEEYYRLNSEKQAKRKLAKLKKELEQQGFKVYEDGAFLYRRYIGECEEWKIEKKLGSDECGKTPYC